MSNARTSHPASGRAAGLAPMLSLIALLASACGGEDPTPAPESAETREVNQATALCLATLHGDVAKRSEAIDALAAVTEAYPNNARAFFYLGMCSLAALVEDDNVAVFPDIEPALARAHELAPDNLNMRANLWLFRLTVALLTGDQAAVDESTTELIATADADPFNTFVMSFGLTQTSPSTGLRAMAAQRFEQLVADCPSYSYCTNSDIVRHHDSAMYMHAGDLFVRIGDQSKAESYYQQAFTAEGAETWPYSAEAEEWAAAAAERVALHTDADPANDPPLFISGARVCRSCHQ